MIKQKNLILSWNESDIINEEAHYIKKNIDTEEFTEYKNKSIDDIRKELFESDFIALAWDDLKEALNEYLIEIQENFKKKHNETVYNNWNWITKVNNFGWRNLDGSNEFIANNSEEFLSKILPKCDCTFYIYKHYNGLKIRNFHHDSPMGNEYYYIKPMKQEVD